MPSTRPYRHLSSGMQVRLGFAVISSLDEPIFLVDEVLAVGDKAFRYQCVLPGWTTPWSEGTHPVLVSHSGGRPATVRHPRAVPPGRRSSSWTVRWMRCWRGTTVISAVPAPEGMRVRHAVGADLA